MERYKKQFKETITPESGMTFLNLDSAIELKMK